MSCSAAGLNRSAEHGDRRESLDVTASGSDNSIVVDECVLRLSERPGATTVSESPTKADLARVPRPFQTSGGVAAASAMRSLPRSPPCLFQGYPETGRDGGGSYLSCKSS